MISDILRVTREVSEDKTPFKNKPLLLVTLDTPNGEQQITVRLGDLKALQKDLSAVGWNLTDADLSRLIEAWEELVVKNPNNVAQDITNFLLFRCKPFPKVTSLSSMQTPELQVLLSEPDREFTPKEIARLTGKSVDAVKQSILRLKEKGLVKKISHGYYKYNSEIQDSQFDIGLLGIENVLLIRKSDISGDTPPQSDTLSGCYARPSGYPRTLPTGQIIDRGQYSNGTEFITLSAKGHPPFPISQFLHIIDEMIPDHERDNWIVSQAEINADIPGLKTEGNTITLRVYRGTLLKLYEHYPGIARFELALRDVGETVKVFCEVLENIFSRQKRHVKG